MNACGFESRRPHQLYIRCRELLHNGENLLTRISYGLRVAWRKSSLPTSRRTDPAWLANARSDALLLIVLVGGVILLIWNGHLLLSEMSFGHEVSQSARVASSALMLNVALILFGWRRYVDLQHENQRRIESDQRAQQFATSDALTGLLNRKGFADRAGDLAQTAHDRAERLHMFSIQLHRFKSINDRHGFDVGDDLLRRIAAAVTAAVDHEAAVARLSGDEFAIATIAPAAFRGDVEALGERLLRSITSAQDVDGKLIQVGAFIGLAMSDRLPMGTADLLRRADIALDHAKTARSARPVWFDCGMERALLANSEIEQGIRLGLDHEQFEPYFEPQVDLQSGDVIGFEVLARWKHPLSGLIMPDIFIPVAEEIGLIGRLSEQVMRSALTQAAEWDSRTTLAVNIAPTQLSDPWLAQKIMRLLAETGFPANRLLVEITESSLFADIDQARSIVRSLKNQGIRLALDDFGTGFSSLSHLRSLPFDVIKIDRSFIATLRRDRESAAIVRAVTTLATAIGVPVTVEGIEDAATHDAVLDMGCATGQGWYFGKPMSGDQAAQHLRNRALPVSLKAFA